VSSDSLYVAIRTAASAISGTAPTSAPASGITASADATSSSCSVTGSADKRPC
jgi:hypothetical protein